MKPLIVLLAVFVITIIAISLVAENADYAFAGKLAMSAMLVFTSIGHFAFSKGMMLMLPVHIPFKKQIVYATGLIEIAAAAGLLIHRVQHITAWLLIIFFLAVLPANINAAFKRVDYQKGTYGGSGVGYLLFRIPLQIFFIAWVYFFGIFLV